MQAKHLFTLDYPLRWVDMDAYHHISQTCYFNAMTETRSKWMQSIADETLQNCFFYIVQTSCDFYHSLKYPNIMRIKQYTKEVLRSSFVLEYHIGSINDELHYAKGLVRLACVSAETEKSIRIPKCIKDELI